LLGPGDQPDWRTVTGGSARYVKAILEPLRQQGRLHLFTPVTKLRRHEGGVELLTVGGPVAFDHVVVATHSDQALALLGDPSEQERRVLGSLRYQPNRATLHTDTTLLPTNRRAWASWNYVRAAGPTDRATLTYYLNRLQGFEAEQPVLVTLNRDEAIDPDRVVARFDYAHPVIDQAAVAAQASQRALSAGDVSYCGAYWGYGFHEDGVRSALAVCERLGARP
jgi:predicted NAD/FAD-binding protein